MTATNYFSINDKSNGNNVDILSFVEAHRLDSVLNETLSICGDCGLPTISITIKDFILAVKQELHSRQFPMVDMRLNGGAAAAILDGNQTYQYNDIDILINLTNISLTDDESYFSDTITAVLDVIEKFLQPMTESTEKLFRIHKRSYIQKLIRIQNSENGDNWSLLSLGGGGQFQHKSRRLDLKFTHQMKRQYEFSIDSFQIVLDSLLTFYEALCNSSSSSSIRISRNFYPTINVISKWNSLSEALDHLTKKHIVTVQPEHIRGGGLLKYCKLLVHGFVVPKHCEVGLLERYMCSRFFIDYIDLLSQRKAVDSYIRNHFHPSEFKPFLVVLRRVISSSSVCLMNHERQQTLSLIDQIIMEVNSCIVYHPSAPSTVSLTIQQEKPLVSKERHRVEIVCFSDPNWTVAGVFSGLPDGMGCCCRSPSTNSTVWDTPTDMSPVDTCDEQ